MTKPVTSLATRGEEHWTKKGDVRLFLWEKRATTQPPAGTILFVHGSSMASTPTFDLQVPTGTYVDMCSRLPLVDPLKIPAPTIVMRGQWDGIASFDDLLEFFRLLPNPDKQFAVMPGISHASFQQKNYMLVYDILYGFFAQTAPVYLG